MSPSPERRSRHRGRIAPLAFLLSVFVVVGFASTSSAGNVAESGTGSESESMTPDAAPADASAMIAGTDQAIAYDVIDGMAVVEGDIIVGTHAEVQQNGIEPAAVTASTCLDGYQCGVIDNTARRQWPGGVIPYTLSPGTSSGAVTAINRAIAEWESKTAIDFVPRTNQNDYVEFRGTGNGNTCSSLLGRSGGRQFINYSGTGQGCLVHEIGHAVGLSHEQNRNDRDDYINIDYTNLSQQGATQFRKATFSVDVGAYDFGSVMHYGPYSFALNRSRPVITPKIAGVSLSDIGGRGVLTPSDVQAVDFVYGTGNPPPPPTTTTTAPTTTRPPTTAAPTTAAPTTAAPTTPTTAPTTAAPEPRVTTTTTATVTVPTTVAPPTTPAPTLPPAPPVPVADVKPTVSFLTHTDGGTMAQKLPYGGLQVGAYDANVGTNDGDGIRYVVVVLSDAETGRYLGARREFRSTYDFGVRLTSGRSYTFTAYARADRSAGGGYSKTSITVTAE